MTTNDAIEKMREAFRTTSGTTLLQRDPEVTAKWVTWTTPYRAAALGKYMRLADKAGVQGTFMRPDDQRRATVVGCLNPEYRGP